MFIVSIFTFLLIEPQLMMVNLSDVEASLQQSS